MINIIYEYYLKNFDEKFFNAINEELNKKLKYVYLRNDGCVILECCDDKQLNDIIYQIEQICSKIKKTTVKMKIQLEENDCINMGINFNDPIIGLEKNTNIIEVSLNTDVFNETLMKKYIMNKLQLPICNEQIKNSCENSKILPLSICNDILTSCRHVFKLSIINSKNWFNNWFYNNFNNIYISETKIKQLRVDYFVDYSEVLDEKCISTNEMEFLCDILLCLKNWIDLDFYVKIELDEYYMPQKRAYKRYHMVHHSLVYGYDDNSQELSLLTYFDDNGYKLVRYSYDIIKHSYMMARMIYVNSESHIRLFALKNITPQRNDKRRIKAISEFLFPDINTGVNVYKILRTIDMTQKNAQKIGYMTFLTISQHLNHIYFVLNDTKMSNDSAELNKLRMNCELASIYVQQYLHCVLTQNNMRNYRTYIYNYDYNFDIAEKIFNIIELCIKSIYSIIGYTN